MISDFREEGGRFSKIGESLSKKTFSIGKKSEMGGRGVKNDPKRSDIIYGRPPICLRKYCTTPYNQTTTHVAAAAGKVIVAGLVENFNYREMIH